MAAENTTAASGGRSGSGGATAESYIGSVISLTSKSEIRYEGILYNINTEESSIGLRNVRSYGTEGRRKEGPQVPPGDKIYEYILFRGSDIKDLQVKASPPVQTSPPINSDPAIIQSHYPHPHPIIQPTSLPSGPSVPPPDHGSSASHIVLPGSNLQSGLPLYQPPGGNLNSWGSSLPNPGAGGLAMPMYWQGYYGTPPGGIPQLPQQPFLRPPPGLPIPPSIQQMQLPSFNSSPSMAVSSLPTSSTQDQYSPLVPNVATAPSLTSNSLPASLFPLSIPPLQIGSLASDTISNLLRNKVPVSASVPSPSLPPLSRFPAPALDNKGVPSVGIKPIGITGSVSLSSQQNAPQPRGPSISVGSAPAASDALMPPLVTPGQLLQTAQKDVEVVQVSPRPSPDSVPLETEARPPILPLPPNARMQKPNGNAHSTWNNYRGRGGRGVYTKSSLPVAKFTEDFDFTAMNEKFKKNEVWGNLGKGSSTSQSKDKQVYGGQNGEEEAPDEVDRESSTTEIKQPVYNKDDFFDTLSCSALDNDPNHGRPRYSEQMKLDTETFGEFSRYHRGGRGGRGLGGRSRGYGGRRGGFSGGGYGYTSRGRGMQSRTSY